jgi:diguanylate cyclase (GGDEF)-like protein
MNSLLDIYSIVVLFVILISVRKLDGGNSTPRRIFIYMVFVVIITLLFNILSHFTGLISPTYLILNQVGNLAVFILGPSIFVLWILYVSHQLLYRSKEMDLLKKILIFVLIINGIMVFASQFGGWYYKTDAFSIYHSGVFYWFFPIIQIGLNLISIGILVKDKNNFHKKHFGSMVFLPTQSIVGIVLQMAFPNISIGFTILTLSILIYYINIQIHNLETDYLTGVANRRKLEIHLKNRVEANPKPFSVIMLDLDNFKSINDNFGHFIGDKALIKAAKLLQSNLKEHDLLARFGGDEFCIITEIENPESLQEFVNKIRQSFKEYNKISNLDYQLEISLGYMVYKNNGDSPSTFLRQLDMKMYEEKKRKKLR